MQNNQPRPSWLLTLSFWVALTALNFTSGSDMFLLVGLLALGPHLTKWRMPRDSSAIWIIRLLIFGGAFVFFGGNPALQPEESKQRSLGIVLEPMAGMSFSFRPIGKGKLLVELAPRVRAEVIVSQERAAAFRAWLEQ